MKKALKWTGIAILGLSVILISGGIIASSVGTAKANKTYDVAETLLDSVPEDSASIAFGAHLAQIHGCASCHGDTFEGKVFVDAPPFLVSASNLTPGIGGIGQSYSIQDWDRAIRYGVKPDGKASFIMPSKTIHNLSDEDTGALLSYLRTIPPVDNALGGFYAHDRRGTSSDPPIFTNTVRKSSFHSSSDYSRIVRAFLFA